MEVLAQLGIDHTYFFQLALFILTLFVLANYVFKDFVELLDVREQRTKGSEVVAVEEQQRATELHQEYEVKARALSGEVKSVFDNYRHLANEEYEKIVSAVREESAKLIEETRDRVSSEVNDEMTKLKKEAPLVAQAMAFRLLSKDPNKRNLDND